MKLRLTGLRVYRGKALAMLSNGDDAPTPRTLEVEVSDDELPELARRLGELFVLRWEEQ